MRKSLWIILVVLVVAVGAPIAHADSFTATFTCNAPCTSTPTAPTVSFPSPTTITETWAGFSASIPLAAGDLPTDTYTWSNQLLDLIAGNFIDFTILDANTGDHPDVTISTPFRLIPAVDSGTITFTTVAAPEPGTVGLMLLGIGSVFALRKRTGQGLSQAS
jgi:hypothetical protein